jgi:hypothetical protein
VNDMARPCKFCLCVKNTGFEASLEVRKIYVRVRDARAEEHGFVRIVDESDEDYLYPQAMFVPIEVPQEGKLAFSSTAS